MNELEKTAALLEEEGDGSIASVWHILGPLFVLSAFALSPRDPLILSIGVLGLLLSVRWQIRGFCYALALLGITAICEHAYLTDRHLWQLGLEGSYAIAFLITALSSEQRTRTLLSLNHQISALGASICNLEDETLKTHEASTSSQIAFQERIDLLQKQAEEMQSELSSILILNEVLRKTEAIHAEDKAFAKQELFDHQQRMMQLQKELDETLQTAARLKESNSLPFENQELTAQLNAARYAREQTRLISEMLAREHAKENHRATEATTRLGELQSQFTSLKLESDILNTHLHQFSKERDRFEQARRAHEEVQTERNFLKERLAQAELELATKAAQAEAALAQKAPLPAEELVPLQQKIDALLKFEALYKQLRSQFEEKNAILHQTRKELFHTSTQLQTLLIEKDRREPSPLSTEIEALDVERARLESENCELERLITHLTEQSSKTPSGEKKN